MARAASCPSVLPQLTAAARAKSWLGYSDAGFLLAALYKHGFAHIAHGPVARDIEREGGEAAIARALGFLTTRAPETLEPSIAGGADGAPTAAFNLCILSHLVGTAWMPDLTGHVLMVEEVSEELYRIDRSFGHVLAAPQLAKLKGLRLGRVSDILPNDPDFNQTPEAIARHWCHSAGIPYLGPADIGHDAQNRIIPFGMWPWGVTFLPHSWGRGTAERWRGRMQSEVTSVSRSSSSSGARSTRPGDPLERRKKIRSPGPHRGLTENVCAHDTCSIPLTSEIQALGCAALRQAQDFASSPTKGEGERAPPRPHLPCRRIARILLP